LTALKGLEMSMYTKILVTLDATDADRTVLEHVVPLAKMFGSRIYLLHVADGWAARWFGPDAVSPEVTEDRAYLARMQSELQAKGLQVEAELAFGDPAKEILRWVDKRGCSLIAMSTHGHRFLGDLVLGATAIKVQHRVDVPVLLVRASES
jgi:nucleotide-binding universal stress UspA family protein